jgi:hypothetical protein
MAMSFLSAMRGGWTHGTKSPRTFLKSRYSNAFLAVLTANCGLEVFGSAEFTCAWVTAGLLNAMPAAIDANPKQKNRILRFTVAKMPSSCSFGKSVDQ